MSTEKNRAIIASLIKMGEHAPHLQPHLRPVLDRLTREAVRVTEDPATAFGELRGILQSSDNLLKQLSTYIVMKGSKDPARFVDEVLPYIEGALRGRTGELERTACRYVMQNGVLTRTGSGPSAADAAALMSARQRETDNGGRHGIQISREEMDRDGDRPPAQERQASFHARSPVRDHGRRG